MRDVIEYSAYLAVAAVVRLFPLKLVQRIGRWLGLFVFYFTPIRKKITIENLRYAFPEKADRERRQIAAKSYSNLCITLLEVFWFDRLDRRMLIDLVRIRNVSLIDNLLKKKRGLVLVGGHFGNWELNALAVGCLGAHPLTIIVQRQRNKYVDRFMNNIRTKFNNRVVTMDRAPREILRQLQNNSVVAMLADQSGPVDGLAVNYFNRPTSTHQGPAVFSLRTGAPILMAFILRQPDGTFAVEFQQVDTTDLSGSEDDKVRRITQRHVAMLEEYVTRYPDHWLWMHKRWKHTEKIQQRSSAVHETAA